MNIPDLMFEREKLHTQVKKYKWLFIGILLVFVLTLGKNSIKSPAKNDMIASIKVEGILQHDADLTMKLKEIGGNSKIKAVILHIDSPGGVAYAGEDLYVELKRLSKQKPIVAVMESVAASAGYMIALGTDHIIARNMTLTGSIGVLMQSFELVDMGKKIGVEFVTLKSSPLKAAPNPMEKMTPEVKAAAMEAIDDSYDIFLSVLMEGRKMTKAQALKLANGKVYTGKRAKELKLIDEIGGEEEAIAWLEKNKHISKSAKVVEIEWEKPEGLLKELANFFRNTNQMLLQIFGKNGATLLKS